MMRLMPGAAPSPRRRPAYVRLAVAVPLALAMHGLMLALVVLAGHLGGSPERRGATRPTTKPVVLRGLTAEQWTQNRGETSARVKDERKLVAREKKEREPPPIPHGQIVDVAPGNSEIDPDAKFIAETNNRAPKQTRAKETTAFYRNAMPRRTAPRVTEGNGSDAVERAQHAGNQGLGSDDRPLSSANPKMARELPDARRRHAVELKTAPEQGPGIAVTSQSETEELRGNSKRLNLHDGAVDRGEDASSGRTGQPGVLSLLPSSAVIDRISGAAANDHLQDVAEGDGTFLSTREWRFASFFNRVKQSVGQQWTPQNQLRLRDPTGNIYSGRDRYTLLTITLDQRGRLRDAFVEKSSGLDFLDLEAIQAFERAQPFPNPPPGLLARDETIRFQFGFFLELTGRPGLRLFRSTE